MRSPINGSEMNILREYSVVNYRGKKVGYIHMSYLDKKSGITFIDTILDTQNFKEIHREYKKLELPWYERPFGQSMLFITVCTIIAGVLWMLN